MQVIVTPETGGPPIHLTGERPSEGLSGGSLAHARIQQALARVRAESMRFADYGNASNDLSFQVSREWETPGLAGLYWLTHADAVPPTGIVIFQSLEPGGPLAGEVHLTQAAILAAQGLWEGCSTTFAYRITGGVFTLP